MAFASVGTLGSGQQKAIGDPLTTITTTAAAEVGNLIAVIAAYDNVDTTDTPATQGFNRRLICRDTAGNVYVCLGSAVNGNGAAGAGTQAAVFVAMVTTQLNSGEVIEVMDETDSNRTAHAASAWEFSLGHSFFCLAQDGRAYVYSDGVDPEAISLSGMVSREYLLLHCLAAEGPNSDTYTWDADYTQFDGNGTTGGSAATNQHVRGGFRIATLTGDTVDVTSLTADRDYAQILVAIFEYEPESFPASCSGTLDDFDRANEDPLSDGGNWEAANGDSLELVSNRVMNNDTVNMQMSAWVDPHGDFAEAFYTIPSIDSVNGKIITVDCDLVDLGAGTVDGSELRFFQGNVSAGIDLRIVKLRDGVEGERQIGIWAEAISDVSSGGINTNDAWGIRRTGDYLEAWYKASGDGIADPPFEDVWHIILAIEDTEFVGGQIGLGMTGTSWQGDVFSGCLEAELFLPQIIRYHTQRR